MPACRILCVSLALSACSTIPAGDAGAPLAYQAAIVDAAVVSPRKVAPLRVLPAGPTVSVVSWVSPPKIPCAGGASLPCSLTLGSGPLWVTLSGEVQAACRRWNLRGDDLRRRLEQLLGLPMDPPPAYRKAAFVELRAPRESLARPCLGVDESNPAQPLCTLVVQPATPATLRELVGQQMADSYVVDGPNGPGYPYTRLGYTYDWAPTAQPGHYGASEFIIAPTSVVEAVAVSSTDDYCRAP